MALAQSRQLPLPPQTEGKHGQDQGTPANPRRRRQTNRVRWSLAAAHAALVVDKKLNHNGEFSPIRFRRFCRRLTRIANRFFWKLKTGIWKLVIMALAWTTR
jgi:hypothetical protein